MNVIKTYSLDVRSKKPTMFGKLIMWWSFRKSKIKRKERWHHCAGVVILEDNTALVYDANMKFEENNFYEWAKDYEIVNISDTTVEYDLTQDQKNHIHHTYKLWVGTKYGVRTILGLVWHDITKFVTIGKDGIKRLICSESEMRIYEPYLGELGREPLDYWDPYERGKVFSMKYYKGQLDSYKE